MALTCVGFPASQMIKKSATASFIFRRSSDTMCSPFFSCIAAIMVLMIFEFFVNRAALFFLREVNNANCSKYERIMFLVCVAGAGRLLLVRPTCSGFYQERDSSNQ